MSLIYILKLLAVIAVPVISYFAGKNIPFFKRKPIYHSQAIGLISVLVGCLLFWREKNCVSFSTGWIIFGICWVSFVWAVSFIVSTRVQK